MENLGPEFQPAKNAATGWISGFIGVVIFSGSLPATRIAVSDFDPVFLTASRATIAGILSACSLLVFKVKLPQTKQIIPLIVVAIGVIIGFPLLSALALQDITSAHAIVFLGILPLSTAIFGIVRGKEKPPAIFWLFSVLGSLLVIGYSISQNLNASLRGDALMLAAVLICGLGYAEGAKLSRTLGGWQVISWALLFSLPVMLCLTFLFQPDKLVPIRVSSWLSLGYLGVFSMFIGFIFWYKGLAEGGIATVGQLQLLQPLLGLALAAFIVQEEVSPGIFFVTLGVIACVAGTKKFAKSKLPQKQVAPTLSAENTHNER